MANACKRGKQSFCTNNYVLATIIVLHPAIWCNTNEQASTCQCLFLVIVCLQFCLKSHFHLVGIFSALTTCHSHLYSLYYILYFSSSALCLLWKTSSKSRLAFPGAHLRLLILHHYSTKNDFFILHSSHVSSYILCCIHFLRMHKV